MGTKKHRCKGNDHISLIASKYGFFSWKTIWDENQGKVDRKDPNILFKGGRRRSGGDVLTIPAKKPFRVSKGVDATHEFEVKKEVLMLRLRVLKEDFTAVKEAEYELRVKGVKGPFKGKTDGEGKIKHEIPATSVSATLSVRVKAEDTDADGDGGGAAPAAGDDSGDVRGAVPVTWKLQIGALNPILEEASDDQCVSGVQQRLNNIAVNSGPVDGLLGPLTKGAVKAFQDYYKMAKAPAEQGIPDPEETQKKLSEVHDKPGTPPAPPAS